MMADRGITLTHTTILRWVQHYLPEFEKRWSRYARPVGGSWRTDETYIKVRGSWVYLYRAVDKAGQTVDFYLSRNRDVNAAKTFLHNAMKKRRTPTKITLDAYAASHRAVREMKETGELARRARRTAPHSRNRGPVLVTQNVYQHVYSEAKRAAADTMDTLLTSLENGPEKPVATTVATKQVPGSVN
jgi:transposase-like protein